MDLLKRFWEDLKATTCILTTTTHSPENDPQVPSIDGPLKQGIWGSQQCQQECSSTPYLGGLLEKTKKKKKREQGSMYPKLDEIDFVSSGILTLTDMWDTCLYVKHVYMWDACDALV